MKRLIVILTLSLTQHSYANCSPDFEGVQSSSSSGVSSFVPCEGCRSAQDFKQDFIARTTNYVFHTSQGLAALGSSVGSGSGSPLTFPVCSTDHGQCVTATVSVDFNYITVPIAGINIPIPMGVKDYTTRVTDAGGNYAEITSQSADAPPVYLIPADTTADSIADGECKTNTGQDRSNNSDSNNDGNTDGGNSGGGGGGGTYFGGGRYLGGGGGGSSRPRCWSEDRGDEIVVTCIVT